MIVEAIRLLIILAFTVIGLQLAPEILDVTGDGAIENARLIGASVGAGVGYVSGGIFGRLVRSGIHSAPTRVATEISGAELFAGGFGLLVGVVVGGVMAIPVLIAHSQAALVPDCRVGDVYDRCDGCPTVCCSL